MPVLFLLSGQKFTKNGFFAPQGRHVAPMHNYTQKNESEHLTNQQHETLKN